MGVWENFKARRQAKKDAEINAEIQRIEDEKGKRLTQKGREKVTKNVETKRKRRGIIGAIVAVLGSVGITTFAGHALLTSGNQPEVGDKTNIETETENKDNTPTSKKDEYLKQLQNMDLYDQTGISKNTISNTEIIDQILEAYNENLSEDNKEQIDENDLGIIYQNAGSEGQIIEDTSGDEVTYIKAPKSVDELEDGQTHVDDQIKGGYYLVNKENDETVTAVIEKADGYYEIRADYVSIKDANGNETVYTRNPDTYVDLENLFDEQLKSGEISLDTIGGAFENYYGERIDNLTSKNNESKTNDDELEF